MLVFDRYYQIVKCFRDEDLRGDRQPEFTQVDLETSFLNEQEIQDITEGLIAKVMKETKGIEVTLPFPRMSYDDAMNNYGSDKPDTRFDMLLQDLTEVVKGVDFKCLLRHQLLRQLLSKEMQTNTHVKVLNKLTELPNNLALKVLLGLR